MGEPSSRDACEVLRCAQDDARRENCDSCRLACLRLRNPWPTEAVGTGSADSPSVLELFPSVTMTATGRMIFTVALRQQHAQACNHHPNRLFPSMNTSPSLSLSYSPCHPSACPKCRARARHQPRHQRRFRERNLLIPFRRRQPSQYHGLRAPPEGCESTHACSSPFARPTFLHHDGHGRIIVHVCARRQRVRGTSSYAENTRPRTLVIGIGGMGVPSSITALPSASGAQMIQIDSGTERGRALIFARGRLNLTNVLGGAYWNFACGCWTSPCLGVSKMLYFNDTDGIAGPCPRLFTEVGCVSAVPSNCHASTAAYSLTSAGCRRDRTTAILKCGSAFLDLVVCDRPADGRALHAQADGGTNGNYMMLCAEHRSNAIAEHGRERPRREPGRRSAAIYADGGGGGDGLYMRVRRITLNATSDADCVAKTLESARSPVLAGW